MRPLRLMKSCQASSASREYWFRSRTISLRWRIDTLVISGFFTVPPKTAFSPVFRPCSVKQMISESASECNPGVADAPGGCI